MEKRFAVGNFIYELRREKGLTQRELAGLMGVSDKAVSKWETGSSMMRIEHLDRLSDILGCTREELLQGRRLAPAAPGGAAERVSPASERRRERRFYTDAHKGVGDIAAAKILALIYQALFLIFASLRDPTGSAELFYILLAGISIAAIVKYVQGLARASRNEPSFTTALLLIVAGFIIRFLGNLLPQNGPAGIGIASAILSELLIMAVDLCILNGVRILSVTFENYGEMLKWDRALRIAVISTAVLNSALTVVLFAAESAAPAFVPFIILTLTFAREIMLIICLFKAKKRLGEGYFS
ncbi:MAG: helix-turn-helix transcriptional regulator [Clostridia bacterium]|nr:helix-turn-helix transcriptional regulator [Clostridia bacterium]